MLFPEFSKKKMVHFPQILKLPEIHSHALNFLSAKDVHVKKLFTCNMDSRSSEVVCPLCDGPD